MDGPSPAAPEAARESAGAAIRHVSDTALWVAYYRALESERPDALFRDRFARALVGSRGQQIAKSLSKSSPYTQWTVVIRTLVIDLLLQEHVAAGIDTVVNLGAGLDTRPYRLELPPELRWIEVDYPNIVEHKERLLQGEKPNVRLERVALDLADRPRRLELFSKLDAQCKRALFLTEGVLPYLTEAGVGALADDLHCVRNLESWVAEYFSTVVYPHLRTKERSQKMRNAPFQFFPADWFAFFREHGWAPREIRYLPEEALKVNREFPLPWWVRILRWLYRRKPDAKLLQQVAYISYEKCDRVWAMGGAGLR